MYKTIKIGNTAFHMGISDTFTWKTRDEYGQRTYYFSVYKLEQDDMKLFGIIVGPLLLMAAH